jgi:hypothetical protein
MKAREAEERDILFQERVFEDVLMYEGVTTHYLPKGRDGEKGIDVWLALEAFEMAIYKRFDVLVLIAGDGDFVPLARKLNTLGTRARPWAPRSCDDPAPAVPARTAVPSSAARSAEKQPGMAPTMHGNRRASRPCQESPCSSKYLQQVNLTRSLRLYLAEYW